MAHTKLLAIVGFFLACVAFFLIVVAFSTSNWLESFHEANSGFVRLGLWSACFKNNYNPLPQDSLGQVYNGCGWIFSYDYKPIYSWLIPPWFLCVQIMMTLAMVVLFITCLLCLLGLVGFCPPNRADITQAVNCGLVLFCAVLVMISVIIFGARSASDGGWIPRKEQNFLSWSFGLAVTAVFFLLFSFMCLLVDGIRIRSLKRKAMTPPSYIQCQRSQGYPNFH